MSRKFLVLIAAIALLSLTLVAAQGGRSFTTSLSGAAEAPGPGDPDGSGTATITLNPGLKTICWDIHVEDITLPASAAHIHEAGVGVPGPVVVPLSAPDASGHSSGCTSVDRSEILEIMHEIDEYYVNVHNSDFPAGALRGQLGK
jgi:hypothetical protein